MVSFALLAMGTMLINVPPLTECGSEPPVQTKQYWFRAERTYVQPWRGPHHVYGLFTVPNQYKFHHLYAATLSIQGVETEFTAGSPEGSDDTVITKPGYYTKRVYISTRTALWFLATGRFGDLRMPCHWWLVLTDTGWRPTNSSNSSFSQGSGIDR